MMTCTCYPSAGEDQQEDTWSWMVSNLTYLANSKLEKDTIPKKDEWQLKSCAQDCPLISNYTHTGGPAHPCM